MISWTMLIVAILFVYFDDFCNLIFPSDIPIKKSKEKENSVCEAVCSETRESNTCTNDINQSSKSCNIYWKRCDYLWNKAIPPVKKYDDMFPNHYKSLCFSTEKVN